MKTALRFPALCVLAFSAVANFAHAADAQEPQILAKDLKTLEIPGKVVAVVWTVRAERCTLQVVFPTGLQPGKSTVPPPDGAHRHPLIELTTQPSDSGARTGHNDRGHRR